MGLGERIYKLRTEKGMSQGDLADALEVSRQSISKWETNSSVPDLDNVVKLSRIFHISLDELILDKQPPKQSAAPQPQVFYVEHEPRSGKKVVGVVLLCFAALLFLMVTLFGDIIAGLVLAAPFVSCGMICLLARRNVGLWCSWVVYLFMDIYLRFASGVNWQYVFLPQIYSGGWTFHLIVAWCLLAIFAVLTIVAAMRTRKTFPGSLHNDLIGMAAGLAIYIISWFIFALPAYEEQNGVVYSQSYRYVSAVSGWVRHIVLVVALIFTIRTIASILDKRKQK